MRGYNNVRTKRVATTASSRRIGGSESFPISFMSSRAYKKGKEARNPPRPFIPYRQEQCVYITPIGCSPANKDGRCALAFSLRK